MSFQKCMYRQQTKQLFLIRLYCATYLLSNRIIKVLQAFALLRLIMW